MRTILEPLTDEKEALEILGEREVVTVSQAGRAWSHDFSIGGLLPYRTETLLKCAAQNLENQHHWMLINVIGFSFWEQRLRMGTNRNRPPYFVAFPCPDFYPAPNDSTEWRTAKHASGYRLINFYPWIVHNGIGRKDLEQVLRHMDKRFEAAPVSLISEALFSVFLTHGTVPLHQTFGDLSRHVGVGQGPDGGQLWVGSMTPDGGVTLDQRWGDNPRGGICVIRPPDLSLY